MEAVNKNVQIRSVHFPARAKSAIHLAKTCTTVMISMNAVLMNRCQDVLRVNCVSILLEVSSVCLSESHIFLSRKVSNLSSFI